MKNFTIGRLHRKITKSLDQSSFKLKKAIFGWLRPYRGSVTPFFVLGLGRSGTTLLVNILDRSFETHCYPEGDSKAFQKFRFRKPEVIDLLVKQCRKKIVVFKPLQDSHRFPEMLDRFPNAKAVWVYRNIYDLVNSTSRSWGRHPPWRDDLKLLLDRKGRFSEGISDQTYEFFRSLYSNDISLEDEVCLMWYIRNVLYIEKDMDKDERIGLVNYENMVMTPASSFKKIFRFIACRFDEKYVKNVFSTSVGKNSPPAISGEIIEGCENLYKKLQSLNHLC